MGCMTEIQFPEIADFFSKPVLWLDCPPPPTPPPVKFMQAVQQLECGDDHSPQSSAEVDCMELFLLSPMRHHDEEIFALYPISTCWG
jgi:hypothetical protein